MGAIGSGARNQEPGAGLFWALWIIYLVLSDKRDRFCCLIDWGFLEGIVRWGR